MLIEVIEVNNQYYIDHTQIESFDCEKVYTNPLSDEYDEWVKNNLDELYTSYCIS